MNQKLIIEAYKSIEYKGGEKLGSITVQINPDSYKLSKSTSYKKDESIKGISNYRSINTPTPPLSLLIYTSMVPVLSRRGKKP